MKKFLYLAILVFLFSCSSKKEILKVQKYHKGFRFDKNGWIYVHIEGDPYERGFQYGYLIAEEYKKAFKCYSDMTLQSTGIPMEYIIKTAIAMQKKHIPQELLEEMKGIAAGISARGQLTTIDEILAWNAYIDIAEGYLDTLQKDFVASKQILPKGKKEKCSAFIASGNATKDGGIIIAHSTFDNFWNAQFCNIILDIKPEKGNKILMQTQPAFIASMTDFFILESSLVAIETSLAGFNAFNENAKPSYVCSRLAMQYADSIDSFIDIISDNNNGGNAASWLIGDLKTNEIAKLELGVRFKNIQKKKDGYFVGCNLADDPYIRNLECSNTGYNDIRRHTGGRRLRFKTLLNRYYGKIDVEVAKKIMSDHYDVYLNKTLAHANTICAHYDEDPRYSMSSTAALHPDPYTPAGSLDCKISSSEMAKNMKFLAIFGRACGKRFLAQEFFKKHPQWSWQEGYLLDRPTQPWSEFISYK